MSAPEWKTREKHETEARALLKDLGFTDCQGRIRKWDGKAFWPRWEAKGHSSLGFENCSCRKTN